MKSMISEVLSYQQNP